MFNPQNLKIMQNSVKVKVEKVVKVVTINELETILKSKSYLIGASVIANITQLTEPKCTKFVRNLVDENGKKVEFTGLVEKKSVVSIILNTDYGNAIERQKTKEEKAGLETSEYEKGKNTMPLDLCENNSFFGYFNGNAVLQYRPNDNIAPKSQYYLDGKEIEKNALPDVLPITQKAQNQGNEREILWRKVYLNNVLELTLDKVHYVIKK